MTGVTAMTLWQGGRMTEVTGWQSDRSDSLSGWILLSVVCCVSKTREVADKTLQQLISINKTVGMFVIVTFRLHCNCELYNTVIHWAAKNGTEAA